MRKRIFSIQNILRTLFVVLAVSLASVLDAQSLVSADSTTLVSISTALRSTGHVAIYQDPRLEALISSQPKVYYANARKGKDVIVTSGFRIRAFSGSNQIASKNKALKIEEDLKKYNPDLETYVIFKSPNWRLLLGNFTTNEEAISVMRDLKKHFPEYGREMFVIKDQIEISR